MSMVTAQRATLRELEDAFRAVDPAVLLVSPRLLRRVIRLDRRIGTFGRDVPHSMTYLLPQDRLFDCVTRFELELDSSRRLSETVLLIARPDEESLQTQPAAAIFFDYWRRLFHVRVHQALEQRIAAGR